MKDLKLPVTEYQEELISLLNDIIATYDTGDSDTQISCITAGNPTIRFTFKSPSTREGVPISEVAGVIQDMMSKIAVQ
jgi:hypothetical protein